MVMSGSSDMLDNSFKFKRDTNCQVWFLACFFNNGFQGEKPTERSNNTMFTNRALALASATLLMSLTVFAQEDYTRFKSEAGAQALGSFVTQTTQNGIDHSATDSSGVLATYRYYFTRHNGVAALWEAL
jgi:hypothetical protein